MKYLVSYFLIISSFFNLSAQQETVVGAPSFALAGNSTQLLNAWSVENNPGTIALIRSVKAGINYQNSFTLAELSTRSAAFLLPISNGSFGLAIKQYGYAAYNENKVGISYGKQLGETISLGIQINYLSTRIGEGYGSNSSISSIVGLHAKVSEELTLSTVIINPNRAKLATQEDERYPTFIKLGALYHVSEKVKLLAQIDKDIDYKANGLFGIEYHAIDQLFFRAGYATTPSLSAFGFGLKLDGFQFDLSASFDSNLGFSPTISLQYTIDRKDTE